MKALAGMGISLSDAVRMLLVRVAAEKALPFRCEGPQRDHRKGGARRRQGQGKASGLLGRAVRRPRSRIRCGTWSKARSYGAM